MTTSTRTIALIGCGLLALCSCLCALFGLGGYAWTRQVIAADLPPTLVPRPAFATLAPGALLPTPVPGSYQSQTACDHPYFPIRPGATWIYWMSDGSQKSSVQTTVDSVSGDLTQATAKFSSVGSGGGTDHYEMSCSAQGLQIHILDSQPSPDATSTYTYSNYSGQSLLSPALFIPGATWSESYTETNDFTAPSHSATAVIQAATTRTIGDPQQLTIAMGTFEVLPVVNSGTVTISITQSQPLVATPASDSIQATIYYSYGIGVIRTESHSAGRDSVSELIS